MKQSRQRNRQRNRWLCAAGMVLCMGIFTGCSQKGEEPKTAPAMEPAAIQEDGKGTLLIKVNPEIAVEYDEEGRVTNVRGLNDDGKKIVETYTDYIGKECHEVVEELVGAIHDAGYFVEEVEGEKRKITIEIETGSILPEEGFLDEIVTGVQEYVKDMQMDHQVMTEDVDIYEHKYGEEAYETAAPPADKEEKEKDSGADSQGTAPEDGSDDKAPANDSGNKTPEGGSGNQAPGNGGGNKAPEGGNGNQTPPPAAHESPYTDYESSYTDYESPYTDYQKPDSPYEDSHYEDSGYSDYKDHH